jgi:AP-3 complex subunit delta-1
MPNGFQTEEGANAEPSYPKSLFLVQPLFTGYEMNPVGYRAQESVKVPEGLDLDAVLVADIDGQDAGDEFDDGMLTSEEEVDLGQGGGKGLEELRRVLRASEGKEKGKKKRIKKDGTQETPEERLEVSASGGNVRAAQC